MHLFGCEQARERIHQEYRSIARFQVPRSVFQIGSFAKQEITCRLRHAEEEASLRRFQYALLHHPQLDFQNLL